MTLTCADRRYNVTEATSLELYLFLPLTFRKPSLLNPIEDRPKKLEILDLKRHRRQASKTQFSTPYSRYKMHFYCVLYGVSELLQVQATSKQQASNRKSMDSNRKTGSKWPKCPLNRWILVENVFKMISTQPSIRWILLVKRAQNDHSNHKTGSNDPNRFRIDGF